MIKHKLLVLSGKGGVGKSTIAAHLAIALAAIGLKVGLLDIDICGPSIPKMMGLDNHKIHQDSSGWSPVFYNENLRVMSLGFMLSEKDNPIVWRGAKKNALINQFITNVNWGSIDYLVIDTPPGTSDEHLSILQSLSSTAEYNIAALLITTPQEISLQDVRKEINFCDMVKVPIIGLIENMSSFLSDVHSLTFTVTAKTVKKTLDLTAEIQETLYRMFPDLQLVTTQDMFYRSLVEPACVMAKKLGVLFLGSIPFEILVGKSCEDGQITLLQLGHDTSSLRKKEYSMKTSITKLANQILNHLN